MNVKFTCSNAPAVMVDFATLKARKLTGVYILFLLSTATLFSLLVERVDAKLDLASFGRNRSEIDYFESPIIAIGLPKSGSTSLATYLNYISPKKIHALHYLGYGCHLHKYPVPAVQLPNGIVWKPIQQADVHYKCFLAELIQRAVAEGKKPLHYILHYGENAVVQMDCCWFGMNVWPQVDALELLLDAYPSAYFIHHVRLDVAAHVRSANRWHNMVDLLQSNGLLSRFENQNSSNSRDENVAAFFIAARQIVRDTFFRRPDHRFLEVDLTTDADAGEKIAIFLGAKKRPKLWWVAS